MGSHDVNYHKCFKICEKKHTSCELALSATNRHFQDSVDQDQTVQDLQSDLECTLFDEVIDSFLKKND